MLALAHLAGVGQPLQGLNFGADFFMCHHLTLLAQWAADILPLAMFLP